MLSRHQTAGDLDRLRAILDTALDAVVVMRADGTVADWNQVAERTFGWSREEALGRYMSDLIIPPQYREAHSRGLERFNESRYGPVLGQRIEISALRKSGEEFPVELSITVTEGEREHLFVGFLRDITVRLSSQRVLARQAREAELLFRLTRLAAETESVDQVLRASLQAICELTDWPVGHALTVRQGSGELVSTDIWHGEEDEQMAALRERTRMVPFAPGIGLPGVVLATGKPQWMSDTDSEISFIRKGLGYGAAFAFPIGGAGRTLAVLEFFTREKTPPDSELLLTVRTLGEQVGRVVERNRGILELRQLNETLEQRVEERTTELLQAQDQLRQAQKMEAIGQLTGGVAHDFNNLLTIIRSSVDLLRRGEIPEERKRRYLEAISDTADRAAKLTAQLLAFARRQALKPEVFDVAERVQTVCEMVRTLLGSRIDLELDIDCSDCFVEADIGQFETALINVAANARDAIDGEGKLRIAARVVRGIPGGSLHEPVAGEHVAICVSDTGRGMPPNVIEQIFEPFFTTKEVGKGTGLGLSQVYGFAKQSGGDVRVRSNIGAGTEFTLYLPRVERPREEKADVEGRPNAAGSAPRRVLVVEDNLDVGEFAIQILAELGHEARLAHDAAEALAMLEANPSAFDMVFSDVVMPGMSGIELGREIRKRWPGLRTVLTSGYSHVLAQEGRHGFELLQKPYSVEGLTGVLSHG